MNKFPKRAMMILFLATALLPGWACKSSIKEPNFAGARNFTIEKLGLQETYIGMDLYYFNPNNFKLKLKKADLDVFLENRFVGQTQLDTLMEIPARDSFLIPVKMGVNMKNLFPNLLILALKDEVEIKLEGSAKVAKSGITMNIPIHYTGKHKIIF
jgi:LEA14-like dessication related protein